MTATLQTETQIRPADDDAAVPSVRVIEAVADAIDGSPTSMTPLYEAIDPDALDALVASEIDGHVTFGFAGCQVTVDGDATITVEEVR